MPAEDPIELLLEKAAQDEYVLDKLLLDPDAPSEIFGFHAQQAVEKLLKAVLLAQGKTYPKIHSLARLIKLIKGQNIAFPKTFEELRSLTAFAIEFRYEALPQELGEILDKKQIRQAIRDLRHWAEAICKTLSR